MDLEIEFVTSDGRTVATCAVLGVTPQDTVYTLANAATDKLKEFRKKNSKRPEYDLPVSWKIKP